MLEVRDLKKYYKTKGGVEVHALDGVSIQFPETGMVFLLGKSGSGKSTLLNVSGGLDRPDSGEIIVKGKSSKDFSQSDFDSYRNTFVGFVFQEYNILNEFNIETNIALALELQGKKNDKKAVEDLLKQVDLEGLGKRKPNTLSGGQKQRIAIARALIKNPEIIMADEPTGALDSNTGKQVLDTLKKLSETKLVIIVSHDRDFAEEYADRIIELKDGKILSDHSKAFAKAEDISSNIRKIGDNTIQIKDASGLSDAEVAKLIKSLKGNGEIIISNNEENVSTFKKIAKIADDGSQQYFKNTDLKKINIKSYDGSQTKFIKSKLPGRHAFKMGASNLKIKPGRLIFTMFLSVIAFSMFGILSTLMLYNPAYSYATGIQDEAYQSLVMEKKYNVRRSRIKVDKNGKEEVDDVDDNEVDTNTSKSDIEKLNNNNLGLEFAGFYKKDLPLSNCLSVTSELPYYKCTGLNGLCDCGEEFLLRQSGFERLAGHYPTTPEELAVSEYTYEIFEKCGYRNSDNVTKQIRSPEDLIGLKYSTFLNDNYSGLSKPIDFTICGVYRTDSSLKDEKYAVLKEVDHSSVSEEKYDKLQNSFKDVYKSSFSSLGFVSNDFYDVNKRYLKNTSYNQVYIQGTYFYGMRLHDPANYKTFKENSDKSGFYPTNDRDSFEGLTVSQLKDNKQYFTIFDKNGNIANDIPTLNDDEAIISLNNYQIQNIFQNMANYVMGNQYGAYDRDGNLVYFSGKEAGEWCQNYINYNTLDIQHNELAGYNYTSDILLDDDGTVIAYRRNIYYKDDPSNGWRPDMEGEYTNQIEAWVDRDGNFIQDLFEVDLEYFYYDAINKKPYAANEVTYDNVKGKYVLESNHDIELAYYSRGSYYLDEEGLPKENQDGQHITRRGLFFNPTTKELSFEKKTGSVFTDKYYLDTNNNVYLGHKFSNAFAAYDKNNNATYYYYQNGCPVGFVNMNGEVYKSSMYLSDKVDVIEALARYFSSAKQSWYFEQLRNYYPDVAIDDAVETDFGGEDLKLIIQALNQFELINSDPYMSKLTDEFGITTKNMMDYGLTIKGFFIPSNQVNSYQNIILNDNWVSKIVMPSDYHNDQYQWKEKYETKYVVDENAQYDAVIALTDKTTEQLKYMTQTFEDDSFYFLSNEVFTVIYFLTGNLKTIKTVFLVVGIVMATFSGLMLLNLISNSISAKEKEIGILRAVGARGSDVFKIYFSEAAIICLICFVVSAILGGVGCYILNNEMSEGLAIKLFDYGPINLAIILGVAFIVGLLGTLFPVIRASRRPPVESIRAL